jgi:hypothetical protein
MMTRHTFVLFLPDTDGTAAGRVEDDLFAAGCHDALVLVHDGGVCIEFERDGADREAAIRSAAMDLFGAGYVPSTIACC